MSISLTLILVVMTVLISMQAFNRVDMKRKLLMHPYSVKRNKEYYRFLSHGFIHADYMHLIVNMYVLYIFGENIEAYFNFSFGAVNGRLLFLLLYIGAILAGAIPAYLKHQNNVVYSALGASGGTSGIVFAFIVFNPWQWFIFPPLPALFMGIAYLWYSSYMAKQGRDNIGHDAHFWGAVYGFILTIGLLIILNQEMLNVVLQRLMQGPTMPG